MKNNAAVIVFISLLTLSTSAFGLDDKSTIESLPISDQLMKCFGVLVDQHVLAPTKQQLVVAAVRAQARRLGQSLPQGIARRISDCPVDELPALLEAELKQLRLDSSMHSKSDPASMSERLLQSVLAEYSVGLTSQKESKVNKQIEENRYVGIGIQLGQNLKLMKVFPGGPAALSGARAGDHIMAVDGRPASGEKIGTVIDWLRGPRGTELDVEFLRPSSKAPEPNTKTRKMVRDVVPIPSVKVSDTTEPGTRTISVLRIAASTVQELQKIESELPDDVHVVLDLQRTEPGSFHSAHLVASALIDGGSLGYRVTTSGKVEISAEPGQLFEDRAIHVVVGAATTGTAEWLAAALEDRRSATIIGDATRGQAFAFDSVSVPETYFALKLPSAILCRVDGEPLLRPIATAPTSALLENGQYVSPTKWRVVPEATQPTGMLPLMRQLRSLMEQ